MRDAPLRNAGTAIRDLTEEATIAVWGSSDRIFDQVRYVVLETTGDVSVVHGDGDLEPDILSDIVDSERVFELR